MVLEIGKYNFLFFPLCFILSVIIQYFVIRKILIMDVPNHRSSHTKAVPRVGGIGIVISFIISFILYYLLFPDIKPTLLLYWLIIIIPSLILFFFSLYDDIQNMSFRRKLAMQLICASIFLVMFMVFWWPVFAIIIFLYVLFCFWIIGFINCYNFMDGLNGLAGAVASLACLVLATYFFYAYYIDDIKHVHSLYEFGVFYLLLFFVLLGFLAFNLTPAKVFLGDNGSQWLGYVLSTSILMLSLMEMDIYPFLLFICVFFSFIWDTFFTFTRRLIAGEKVTSGHNTHLYQFLNRMGASHDQVVVVHLLFGTLFSGIGFILYFFKADWVYWGILLAFALIIEIIYSFTIMHFWRKENSV